MRTIALLFFLGVIALSFAPGVYSFGAGNIPTYSYLEHKAFRCVVAPTAYRFVLISLAGTVTSRTSLAHWLKPEPEVSWVRSVL